MSFVPFELQDPASTPAASCEDNPCKEPGQYGFLRQLKAEYQIDPDDVEALERHIQIESDRIVSEKLITLMQFFEECKIPKLVVFATLATGGGMKMTEIADRCGVSKQAIHKGFRLMEPAFKKYGDGYERRRNFKLKTPHEKCHDQKPDGSDQNEPD